MSGHTLAPLSPRAFKALPSEQQVERLKALAAVALEQYGLPPASSLTVLSHRENAVFRIDHAETGERYVMRVHREGYQTAQSIRSELQWMAALRHTGIQTPQPLEGVDGQTVQTVAVRSVPEARHCDVLSWVAGTPLSTANSTAAYALLGQTSARMHRHVKNWLLPDNFFRQQWDEVGLLGDEPLWGRFCDLEALSREQLDLLNEAKVAVLHRLKNYGKAPDRFGLIHADLMPENILLHEGVPYVIDFDDSGFGWFMYDLATLLALEIIQDDFQERLAAWVEGYRSVEALGDEHLKELPTFIMARLLVSLGWLRTRKETPMALERTSAIVELACLHARTVLEAQ